jgi:hypothetical protein
MEELILGSFVSTNLARLGHPADASQSGLKLVPRTEACWNLLTRRCHLMATLDASHFRHRPWSGRLLQMSPRAPNNMSGVSVAEKPGCQTARLFQRTGSCNTNLRFDVAICNVNCDELGVYYKKKE